MSMPREASVSCPKCGSEIEYTMWLTINTEVKTAIQDIISGKLFDIECKSCGLKSRVVYPILFNDMLHKMMIQYAMEEDASTVLKQFDKYRYHGFRLRLVSTQQSLREKTWILNDGLDDRIIELMKAIILPQKQIEMPEKQIKEIYYCGSAEHIFFELDCESGEIVRVASAREGYNNLKEQFNEYLDDERTPYVIDRKWADKVLSSR